MGFSEKEKDNKQIFSKQISVYVIEWQHYITPSILFSHSNLCMMEEFIEKVPKEILFSYLVLFKTSRETRQHTICFTTATSANYTQSVRTRDQQWVFKNRMSSKNRIILIIPDTYTHSFLLIFISRKLLYSYSKFEVLIILNNSSYLTTRMILLTSILYNSTYSGQQKS